MSATDILVGLDVGTTKVCALVAEVSEDDQLEVIGVGIVPSRGMRKGIVVDTDDLVTSLTGAIRKAEQQSAYAIESVFVGISGAHIATQPSQGVVAVRNPERQITNDDVSRTLEAARVLTIPPDREIVHVIPRHFIVDDQEGIKNPVGMLGYRMEVQTTVVSGAMTSVNNLLRCIERAGVEVESLVLEPLAAGYGVLTEAERDLGVVLIDIGGGTTDIGVFQDGSLVSAHVLPVGGFQVSNDIAVGLRTPFAAAEEIKIRHGYASADYLDEDRIIDVSSFDNEEGHEVSRRAVSEIIGARMEETLELVREHLDRCGYSSLPAGTVLCGGTAQLGGLRRLASEILEGPVRIGTPGGLYGLTDQVQTPAFATSVGLVKWAVSQELQPPSSHRPSPLVGIRSAVGNWLRNFVP